MFETTLSRGPRGPRERVAWSASLASALLLHAGALLVLAWLLRPATTEVVNEVSGWFDLGLELPGGGGEPAGEAPAPAAPEAPAPPVDEAAEALELAVDDAPVDSLPPDTLDAPPTGEEPGVELAAGSGAAAGTGSGGSGGEGGGAGGGRGGGLGPGVGPGIGRGGGGSAQPLHLVVPRVPRGVSARAARGRSVGLIVQVRGNGTVAEARVERPSGIEALDVAALAAARSTLYRSRADTVAHWTRLEIRF